MKALVTHASGECTLAIVRCLGRKGVDVYMLGERSRHGLDPSFHSRYCKDRINGPCPRDAEYIDFWAQILKGRSIDVLIPTGYLSTQRIARASALLPRRFVTRQTLLLYGEIVAVEE